jgi:phosphoglycolate phosphatase
LLRRYAPRNDGIFRIVKTVIASEAKQSQLNPMKLLLFDIDGTLLHTGGAGRIAFEIAFEELFGIVDSWADLVPDGKTDPVIIEEITQRCLGRNLSQKEYDALCTRYHFHFRREVMIIPKYRLMPGVAELLETLEKNQKWFLGIATGNFQEAAWAKLERGKIHHYFKFGGFACDSRNRTELTQAAIARGEKVLGEKINPNEILLIGDTPLDIAVGKNLKIKTVGVATGRTSVKDFELIGADYAFQDLSNTQAFIDLLQEA